MVKVQLAFQGGGAKLANLLAAAEALEDAHNSNQITITRVAGTSAGAIVACLLASGVGMANVRKSLQTPEMQKVAVDLSDIGKLSAVKHILMGSPIKSFAALSDWLSRTLNGNSTTPVRRSVDAITQMRTDRKMELIVVSSDLRSRGSRQAALSDDAISAVADSCAIPLAFRSWRSENPYVDGGMCSNLPVDFLWRCPSQPSRRRIITAC